MRPPKIGYGNIINLFVAVANAISVPPLRNCSDWATQHRIITAQNAEPGNYKIERVPYLYEPSQAVIDPRYNEIVILKASQMGMSEFLLNIIGQVFFDNPSPVAYVCPNRKLAKSISVERFMGMARNCPELFAKIKGGEDSEMFEKFIGGAPLRFTWSSSATECASHPYKYVLIDEVDRMVSDAGGEGNPIELFFSRLATFLGAKMISVCSPTIVGASAIGSRYESGTKHVWNIRCISCGNYIPPSLSIVKWENSIKNIKERSFTAHIPCERCKKKLYNADIKNKDVVASSKYIAKGQYVDNRDEIVGEVEANEVASFKVSGICSPWNRLEKLVYRFLKANTLKTNRIKSVQVVVNTGFGELFEIQGESVDYKELYRLKSNYEQFFVPSSTIAVIAGVDVQGDCVKYSVRAFLKEESFLIDYGVVVGSYNNSKTWDKLEEVLNCYYEGEEKEDGNARKYYISHAFIDSGFKPHFVYRFCKRNPAKFIPVKGVDKQHMPIVLTKVETTIEKKRHRLTLMKVWDDFFKGIIKDNIEKIDSEICFWFCCNVSDLYLKEIVAEQLIIEDDTVEWIKKGINDYLDCEKYIQAGALYYLGIGNTRKKRALQGVKIIKRGIE